MQKITFTLSAKEFIAAAANEKRYVFIVVNRFDNIKDKEKCRKEFWIKSKTFRLIHTRMQRNSFILLALLKLIVVMEAMAVMMVMTVMTIMEAITILTILTSISLKHPCENFFWKRGRYRNYFQQRVISSICYMICKL